MQWSRLRASVRELLAPSVAKRVDVHMAGYGSSGVDRAWLSLDGRDILSIPAYLSWQRADDARPRFGPLDPQEVLLHEGHVCTIGFLLHRYLEAPFADLVASPTLFLRGFSRFDRRFGTRRLASPSLPEEHPFVARCHAFRSEAEGLPSVRPAPPADDARWHRRRSRGRTSPTVIAAADRALRDRKGRSFAAAVRASLAGETPIRDDTPVAERLRAAFALRDPCAAERLAGELLLVAERSDIGDDPALGAALVSLLACPSPRLGAPSTWRPTTHNAARQFSGLARHLHARHDLPRFLDRAWIDGDERAQRWFIHLGHGASLRTAPDLPLPASAAMTRAFLATPDDCPVPAALRRAQVIALGGSPALADAVRRTRLGHDFTNGPFWEGVVRFFVANPLLDPEQTGPIVDWIQAQRFDPAIAPGAVLPEEGAAPPRPRLSMHGRTVAATLREVEAWHRRLGIESAAATARWAPSGLAPFECTVATGDRQRTWRIREITSGTGLAREGARMEHCVASYARSCAAGRASIWTLESTVGEETTPAVTIEVSPASRRIGQVRGKRNRRPTAEELALVGRWAAAAGLTLDVGG